VVEQLAPILEGIAMDNGSSTPLNAEGSAKLTEGDSITGKTNGEAANVQKARAQVQESFRPG
jgi:hypothetical protein